MRGVGRRLRSVTSAWLAAASHAASAAALAVLLVSPGSARGASAQTFTVVRVDTATADLRLFWRDAAGAPYRRLDRLAGALANAGSALQFGMNAGMYEADGAPVGLLVIDGVQKAPLKLADGAGNFFLKPNGVFLIGPAGPRVVDAADYASQAPGVRFATQSGPLLLKAGRIHPALRAESTSRLVRNGVCVSGRTVLFAMSDEPVNFHEFALYFRDVLHCRDALYLDGVVSSLYAPSLGRRDAGVDLGPMFGVVGPGAAASSAR